MSSKQTEVPGIGVALQVLDHWTPLIFPKPRGLLDFDNLERGTLTNFHPTKSVNTAIE